VSQDPSSTQGATSNADSSKKRALDVLEQDNVVSLAPFEFITCLSGRHRSKIMYLNYQLSNDICTTI